MKINKEKAMRITLVIISSVLALVLLCSCGIGKSKSTDKNGNKEGINTDKNGENKENNTLKQAETAGLIFDNSTLPAALFDSYESLDKTDYNISIKNGVYTAAVPSGELELTLSATEGMPADGSHITGIRISGARYAIFGLATGCTLAEARETLTAYGFGEAEGDGGACRFEKDGVIISVLCENGFSVCFDILLA